MEYGTRPQTLPVGRLLLSLIEKVYAAGSSRLISDVDQSGIFDSEFSLDGS